MDDTLRTPIPFIEWNEQTDDLLVFNDAGILLSSCKWYLDNGFMQYFQHDLGVDNGDILDFRLIDKDEFVLPMTPPGGSIDDIIVRKKEILLD